MGNAAVAATKAIALRNIEKRVLGQITNQLQALGASFKIVFPSGYIASYGEKLTESGKKRTRKLCKEPEHLRALAQVNDFVANIKEPGVFVFPPIEKGCSWAQQRLSARLRDTFGKGTCATAKCDDGSVEVLVTRVS